MRGYFSEIKVKGNRLEFIIDDVDVAVVNSLRRIIVSEIPNIGFEHVIKNSERINIIENTTSLHNEFLKQRLSLVPINFDVEDILEYDESQYRFIIKAANKTGSELIYITTHDIDVYKNDKLLSKDEMERIFPADPDYIPITVLKPNIFDKDNGDVLHIEMRANIDIPASPNGAGYMMTSVCAFRNIIDDTKADEEFRKLDNGNKMAKSDFDTTTRKRYYIKNKYGEPASFLFFLESEYYRIPTQYIVFRGFHIMIGKLNEIRETFIRDKNIVMRVSPREKLYDIKLSNHTDTMGNLLQSLIYNYYIREENRERLVYVGYRRPHPLEKLIILRVEAPNTGDQSDEIRSLFIDDILPKISDHLVKLTKNWISLNKNIQKYSDVTTYL
jgi:DNA-directed RNA polymerase subunit L